MSNKKWVGFDLDGTLAHYDSGSFNPNIVGKPIASMINKVKSLQSEGFTIKIVTARAVVPEQIPIVKKWIKEQGLGDLEVINGKDLNMIALYDDRAIQVITNIGITLEEMFRNFIESNKQKVNKYEQ